VTTADDVNSDKSPIDTPFESVPPSVIRDGLHAMLSTSKKRDMIELKAMASRLIINSNNKFSMSMPEAKLMEGVAEKLKKMPEVVKESSEHIKNQYKVFKAWKNKATSYMNFFPREELHTLYRLVFLHIFESSTKYQRRLSETELFDKGLLESFPRVDLTDVYQRIRIVLGWLQQKNINTVELGPLLNSNRLLGLLDNDTPQQQGGAAVEHSLLLLKEFKIVQAHVITTAQQLYQTQQKAHMNSNSPGSKHHPSQKGSSIIPLINLSNNISPLPPITAGKYLEEHQGCSWSQFIIIITLFCAKQTDRIPYLAFNIGKDPGGVAIETVRGYANSAGTPHPSALKGGNMGRVLLKGGNNNMTHFNLRNHEKHTEGSNSSPSPSLILPADDDISASEGGRSPKSLKKGGKVPSEKTARSFYKKPSNKLSFKGMEIPDQILFEAEAKKDTKEEGQKKSLGYSISAWNNTVKSDLRAREREIDLMNDQGNGNVLATGLSAMNSVIIGKNEKERGRDDIQRNGLEGGSEKKRDTTYYTHPKVIVPVEYPSLQNNDLRSASPEKRTNEFSKIKLERFNSRLISETEYPKELSLEFMMAQSTLTQSQRAYVFHQPAPTGEILTKDEKNAAYFRNFNARNDVVKPSLEVTGDENDVRDIRRTSFNNTSPTHTADTKQLSAQYSKPMSTKESKRKTLGSVSNDRLDPVLDSESPNTKARQFRSRSPSKATVTSFNKDKDGSFTSLHNHAFPTNLDHPDALPASRASSPTGSGSALPSPFMRSRATTPSNHTRPGSKSGRGLSGGVNNMGASNMSGGVNSMGRASPFTAEVNSMSVGVSNMGRSSPFGAERERSSRERSLTAPNSLLTTRKNTAKGPTKFALDKREDSDNDVVPMKRNPKPRPNTEGNAESKSRKFSKKKSLEFMKGCILCEQQFPKSAMETRVMWKHILDLRASWDPSLIPKEIVHLEQTMTMFNLVQVCLFCAQFFDPEYENGIFYPRKVLPQEKSSGGVLTAISSHNSSYDPAKESRRLKEEEREIEASFTSKHPSRAPSAAASRGLGSGLGLGALSATASRASTASQGLGLGALSAAASRASTARQGSGLGASSAAVSRASTASRYQAREGISLPSSPLAKGTALSSSDHLTLFHDNRVSNKGIVTPPLSKETFRNRGAKETVLWDSQMLESRRRAKRVLDHMRPVSVSEAEYNLARGDVGEMEEHFPTAT